MQNSEEIAAASELHALLGRGTRYQGTLVFSGRVRIDGHFVGEIRGDGVLIVGDSALIEGETHVDSLILLGGAIQGRIEAGKSVEVYAPGRVRGDIHTPQLYIEKGVVFEGSCTMPDTQVVDMGNDAALGRVQAPEAGMES